MQETDIGMASETELIKNDGEIADTLESYLFKNGMTNEIKNSIAIFQEWLRESLVLTKNLIPHNLVIKQHNDEILIKIKRQIILMQWIVDYEFWHSSQFQILSSWLTLMNHHMTLLVKVNLQ